MSVRPFSHPRFHYNDSMSSGIPCVICGKEVHEKPDTIWAHVIDGGARFAPNGSDHTDDGSDMGCWPIGPTCYAKHKAFFVSLGYVKQKKQTA
jgi:hypothetical protein